MPSSAFDISIASAVGVTVTATMCSAPTYAVSAVRIVADPVFTGTATVNEVQYGPGSPLISVTGGTVLSTYPFVVTGATTATVSSTTIAGVYSTAATTATFVIPFGTTYSATAAEYEPGASPREYEYSARFITTSNGVTAVADLITDGKIRLAIGTKPRVPVSDSTYKACLVTQS